MDPSILDFSLGTAFSSKVRSLLGSPVISPFPNDDRSFWLIVSFAHSKLKINEENGGFILQSILGGVASEFAVVEIKDWIFKFTVFSPEVGLLIYKLGTALIPILKCLLIFGMSAVCNLLNPSFHHLSGLTSNGFKFATKRISVLTLRSLGLHPHSLVPIVSPLDSHLSHTIFRSNHLYANRFSAV